MRKVLRIIQGLITAVAVVLVASLAFVTAFAQYHRPVGKADAIIILGAAINTPALYNRSLEGLRLYQAGDAPLMVLSGGVDYPKSISEAEYMRRVIVAHSSTTPNLILEAHSHSTYDNIENSKMLLPKARSVIVVSDTFHMARAVTMAKAAGFGPVYWSSPDTSSYYPPGQMVYYYVREALAMVYYVPKFVLGR